MCACACGSQHSYTQCLQQTHIHTKHSVRYDLRVYLATSERHQITRNQVIMGALSAPRPPSLRWRWRALLVLAVAVLVQVSGGGAQTDDSAAGAAADDEPSLRDLFERRHASSVATSSQEMMWSQALQLPEASDSGAFDATGFTGYSGSLSSTSSSSSSSSVAAATFAALSSQQQQQLPHPRVNNKKHHLRRGQRQRTNKNGNSPRQKPASQAPGQLRSSRYGQRSKRVIARAART